MHIKTFKRAACGVALGKNAAKRFSPHTNSTVVRASVWVCMGVCACVQSSERITGRTHTDTLEHCT